MAKPDTSRIDTLEAIMADKRKHESYLAKLEEKRASTPAHVFDRLRDEYLTKLTDLQVRASMEAESLSAGLKADEAAVAEIEARLAHVTEERIEGELRAEVGEYDPKEWGKKLDSLNATIALVEKERAAKVAAFERTSSLLIEARGAATPVEVPAPAVVPLAPAPIAAAPVAPVIPPRVSTPTRAKLPDSAPPLVRQTPMGQPAPPAPPSSTPSPAAPLVVAAAAAAVPAEVPTSEPTEAPTTAPTATESEATPEPAAAAPVDPPRAPTPAKGAPMAGSPSFDELAFLNSVVGRSSTQVKSDEISPLSSGGARSLPLPAAPQPPRPTTNVRSGGDADDSSTGPLGRPTPRTSQAIKTLKCQECGTLNYPTEWYCERCGGELAAL